MKFLSVCSGIEAASVAWKNWQAVAFSEVEPFPCAVLKHHYPSVPNWGDMTKFKEWPDAAVDLLVGGTPCQSFSVAGLRKGLDDPRGNLMLTYLAIAAKYRPAWLVWENVPGVLSSNGGRDFASLLRGLGELGYGWAYRVLDAQYFGVAQRRRRVFVVGHLGDWHRAAAVLFERHSLSGNPAPSRKAREGTAADAQGGVDSGIPATVGALTDGAHMGGGLTAKTPTQVAYLPSVANPLTARMHKGLNTTLDEGQTPIVTTGGVFVDAISFHNRQDPDVSGDVTHPIVAKDNGMGVLHSVAMRESGPGYWMQDAVAGTLRAEGEDRPSRPSHVIWQPAMQVRRITPRECERLQGFPDDYTLIPWRGKEAPDGPRYKALGNSMAVPVMRWIGERIERVAAIKAEKAAA